MIMGMWEILEEGRDDYGRGFGIIFCQRYSSQNNCTNTIP